MSTVEMRVVSEDAFKHAQMLLAGIPDGLNRAMQGAMRRAASTVRSGSTTEIRKRYAISAQALRANENVRVSYSFGEGLHAEVRFSGALIPLWRFDGASPSDDVRQDYKVWAMVEGRWTRQRPGVAASGHQLKDTSATRFNNAFVARMKSGHVGIFERTGMSTASGSDQIREIMGSSAAQMVGSEEVATSLAEKAASKFGERFDHEVTRILNGWEG